MSTEDQTKPPKRKRGRPKKIAQDEGPPPAKQPTIQPLEATEDQTVPSDHQIGQPRIGEKEKAPEPETPANDSSDFHLEVPVSFEESSSDGEVGENIASLVSRNGVLQDKEQDWELQAESSDSSYTTPDP